MRRFFARCLGLLIILISITAAGLYGGAQYLSNWSKTPKTVSALEIVVGEGTPLKRLGKMLESSGLISDERLFRIWVRLYSDYSKFQAGRYLFEGNISPAKIAQMIQEGEIYTPVALQFVIPEGFTAKQIFQRLIAKGIGSQSDYDFLFKSPVFLKEHNIPGESLEGFLYPATYSFTETPSPKDALAKMIETFWNKIPDDYVADLEAKKLSLYEAVTFASLIEHETHYDDERPLVSEVIWTRLKKRFPLGIDAALIYGIKDYRGDIKKKHLKDRSNPYNTRIHRGLPPTPICSPSEKSLRAVLSPSDFGYFYYVVDLEKGGRHHFSKTLKEHNSFVRKFLKDRRKAKGKT